MLILDKKSIIESEGKFGTIFFDIDENKFPDENWNDFVIIILSWWLNATYKLLENHSFSEDFYFMDGSYKIKTGYQEEDKFNMIFIKNNEIIIQSSIVHIEDFVSDILNKVNDLIRELIRLKIKNNSDFKELQSSYVKLQKSYKGWKKNQLP